MLRYCAAIVLVILLAIPVVAAEPTDDLLRYVPSDVAFCVSFRDLRSHSQRLNDSPFMEQFKKSGLGKAFAASPEWQKLTALEEQLARQFKLDWNQLRDDIFGDAVVLAYRPGPPGKPEQEQGLILVRARNARALSDLMDKLNQLMKDGGTLKELQQCEHDGVKYWKRVEPKEESYYLIRGPILVLSGQEKFLQEAITLEKKLAPDKAAPLTARLQKIQGDKALASVWINPRAFDADLKAQESKAVGDQAAFLKTFVQCWKSLDDVGLSLHLHKDVELKLHLNAQSDKFPVELRRLLERASEASELWGRFSDAPLFASAMRTDFSALMQVLALLQTKQTFDKTQDDLNQALSTYLGKSIVEALPDIGPDWGLSVTAPATTEKSWFPSVVFALRVQPGDTSAPVDRGLLDTVHFYAGLAVLSFNKQNKERMSIKTVKFDKLEVRYLSAPNTLPPGLQPAYALHDGYLLLASSPEVLKGFATAATQKRSGDEIPLVRISCKEWRRFLKERREPLAAYLAEQQKITAKEADQTLEGLLTGLEWVDQIDLTQRSTKGQATFTLRLKMTAPLAKD